MAIEVRSTSLLRGTTMSTLFGICLLAALVAGAVGIHDLQVRLERWDRDRHAED